MDTTYTAEFRVNGGAWQDVPGSVTIAGTSVDLEVLTATPTLVGYDRDEGRRVADQPWNTFIEGDNLDVLPTLETEFGKVDLVYIDPPYNTGHEFAYRDDIWGEEGREPGRRGGWR